MRYLKASLLIGFLTALLVAVLFELGSFRLLDQGLANFLGLRFAPTSDRPTQYVLLISLAFGIAWSTVDIPRNSLKIIIAAGALMQVITAVYVMNLLGLFFSPFAAGLAVAIAFAASFVYAQGEAGSRKRVVRAIFGDRISRRTFHALIDSASPLNYEGELREASVIVCEIFNHEQLADTLPVADYVALNNSFLRNAADFLVERGGYLDECDGESLRVVFGSPVADPEHAPAACRAALELSLRLDEVNRECARMWQQTFDYRIGINSGEMVMAAYGSRRLGTFSVAGEPVEWTRRLCAANLIYGSRILIGSLTQQLADSAVEVRPLEMVHRYPHAREREEFYELLAPKQALSEAEEQRRAAFWKGIIHFRAERWEEALTSFREAYVPEVEDAPLEFYLRRVEQLSQGVPHLDWGVSGFDLARPGA